MLVVKVELHSMGKAPQELARAVIKNDSSSPNRDDPYADYLIDTYRGRNQQQLDRGIKEHTGHVLHFPRKSVHVWHLVVRALASCGYGAPQAWQTIEAERGDAVAVPPGTPGGGPCASS